MGRNLEQNSLILKPDKGNGVVVLDRTDYDQGILKIINDTSKFRYCNDLDIKLVLSSFKIGNDLCGVKDPIPGGLRSRVVYKFTCAGCNACYVGETTRHFSTRVRAHLAVDKASHIFKHLQNSERCRSLCSIDCFHILDHATTSFQLKIKEAIHIQNELPCLNPQSHHANLKLYIPLTYAFSRSVVTIMMS